MAVTLAPDVLRDAEITDGIGRGDVGSAARLWVRYWPTALGAARRFVDPEEVPGLAAEALIGTITAVAIGRGPREDVAGFVEDAVRELGEDDEPFTPVAGDQPDLFVSAAMSAAFAELEDDTQHALWALAHESGEDLEGLRALTVLQHYYLAEHADRARSSDCRRAHIALMGIADGSAREGLSGDTWLHLSTCAWCTEAFHETAFSNVALRDLIAPAVLAAAAPVEVAPAVVADPAPVSGPLFADELDEHAGQPAAAEAPYAVELFDAPYDDDPAPDDGHELDELDDEDDDEAAAVLAGADPSRRRSRLVAGLVLGAAAVAVVLAIVVTGLGDDDTATPTASGTRPTATPTTSVPSSPTLPPLSPATPRTSATVAGPLTTPTGAVVTPAAPATTATTPTTKPKPASSPTTRPSTKPSPTTAPTSAPPPSSPTATPTKRCNGLQHLLGIC